MDYEYDDLDTPRIAGIVDKQSRTEALGVVRKDGLEVQQLDVGVGTYRYVSTYEHRQISERYGGSSFALLAATDGAEFNFGKGVFRKFSKPVSAAGALETPDGFDTGYYNGDA